MKDKEMRESNLRCIREEVDKSEKMNPGTKKTTRP